MLPTPSTSHVNYEHIYEPSEDSYLLLDTLSSPNEVTFLKTQLPVASPVPLVLEVGPGSGVVLAFVTAHAKHIFGREDIATLGLDVSSLACSAASQTVRLAMSDAQENPGHFLDCLCGDLTKSIRPASIDVLIFNPPYVPSESVPSLPGDAEWEDGFQRDVHLSSLTTDGGVDGMETTERLLCELPSMLSQRGVAYILLCAQNKPDRVMARIRAWPASVGHRWCVDQVSSSGKKAGWEKLCVIRIWRES